MSIIFYLSLKFNWYDKWKSTKLSSFNLPVIVLGFIVKGLIIVVLFSSAKIWHINLVFIDCKRHLSEFVIRLFVLINKFRERNSLQESFRGELKQPGNEQHWSSSSDASTPLRSRKRYGSSDFMEPLDKNDLSSESNAENENEIEVVVNSLENIQFSLANLSAVDVVENLQIDESA